MVFPKRTPVNLYSCKFVKGSIRVEPFGASTNLRNGTVTASRAPEILGLGYSSRYKVMRLLSGIRDDDLEAEDSFSRNAKEHGKNFEEDAARLFITLFQKRYCPIGNTQDQYTYRATFDDFHLACTPDLILFNRLTRKVELLEIKCPYLSFCKQESIGCGELSGAVRPNHYIQCQTQMLVLGVDSSFLMLYVPNRDGSTSSNISIWKIAKDESFQKFILSNVRQAMVDLKDDQARWKMLRGEKPYNLEACMASMSSHVTYVDLGI